MTLVPPATARATLCVPPCWGVLDGREAAGGASALFVFCFSYWIRSACLHPCRSGPCLVVRMTVYLYVYTYVTYFFCCYHCSVSEREEVEKRPRPRSSDASGMT